MPLTKKFKSNQKGKERDLPVCDSIDEACNIAHLRYWLTPITERLCRCPKGVCPLNYTSLYDPSSQHVSNRAQFKVSLFFQNKVK